MSPPHPRSLSSWASRVILVVGLCAGWGAGCAAADPGEGSVSRPGGDVGVGGGGRDTGTRPGRPGEDGDDGPGSGEDVGVELPDGFTMPDVALGDACGEAADCADGEVCVDGRCTASCVGELDCPEFTICQAGACRVVLCEDDSACGDESNPCIRGRCAANVCERSFVLGALADPTPGDCQRVACQDGLPQFFPDENDLPPDDGIACTVATCTDGIPIQRPNNAICSDGDPRNGEERCSVPDGGCISVTPPWLCEAAADAEPWLAEEVCGNGEDDNGNGLVDEGCPCDFGSVQRCYAGPRGTRGVGVCRDGQQQCVGLTSPSWGPCEGWSGPGTEVCDARDNDCNGCADDVPDCDGTTVCPASDTARPLQWYSLDASAILPGGGSDYRWEVRGPRNSATRSVENADRPQTRVYFDVSGDYELTLTATDDKGTRTACSWIVNVRGDGLRVEMRWDTYRRVDMDLHLHRPGSTRGFCTADDCYFANCIRRSTPLWNYPPSTGAACPGGSGTCQNPRLDIDNISGTSPENINIDNPGNAETFRIMAHMYSGSTTTHPVITVYCGGLLKSVFGESPDRVPLTRSGSGCGGQTWRVADVTMRIDPATGATDCDVAPLLPGGTWDVRTGSSAY